MSVRHALRVVVAGIGMALVGHVLAAAVTYAAGRTLGGGGTDVDLNAGGRFAVVFFAMSTYGGSQVVLCGACLSASVSMRRTDAWASAYWWAGRPAC